MVAMLYSSIAPMWLLVVFIVLVIVLSVAHARWRKRTLQQQFGIFVCPQCGANQPTHANFCRKCGARL